MFVGKYYVKWQMWDFPGFSRFADIPHFRTVHLFIFIYSKQKSNIQNIYTKLFHFYYVENMYSIKTRYFNIRSRTFLFWNAKINETRIFRKLSI